MAYIGNTVQNQGFSPAVDYYNGDGTTVTFTLSRPVASVAQLTAVIENVIQNPSTAFTVAGNSITFTSAPPAGTSNIWVEYTSLVTTYAAISQDPSVIGDITATGGYLAEGDFGNSYIDGTIVDYVTGMARITTGPSDGITLYNGGTSARSALMTISAAGNVGIGTGSPSQKLDVAGSAIIGNTSGNQGLLIGNASGNSGAYVNYLSSSAVVNWQVGSNILNAGSLTFAPSTATGGSTFTTAAGRFDSSGNFYFNSGYGSAAIAYGCRAWVCFNGTGTVAIIGSGNISSITDNGVGSYIVNFATTMVDSNYAVVMGQQRAGTSDFINEGFNRGTNSTTIETFANTTQADFPKVQLAFFR